MFIRNFCSVGTKLYYRRDRDELDDDGGGGDRFDVRREDEDRGGDP